MMPRPSCPILSDRLLIEVVHRLTLGARRRHSVSPGVYEAGAELIRLRDAGDAQAVADSCLQLMELQNQVLEKRVDLQNAVIRTL